MSDDRHNVSRRRLFGLLGRGFREVRSTLDPKSGRAEPAEPVEQYPDFDRILRSDVEVVEAVPDGVGAWRVDLRDRPIPVGDSIGLRGDDLVEPLVVVRVLENHYAACSAECPVDGSELLWSAEEDRLFCPSCQSRWRLDGESTRGPADSALGRYFVDPMGEMMRVTEP